MDALVLRRLFGGVRLRGGLHPPRADIEPDVQLLSLEREHRAGSRLSRRVRIKTWEKIILPFRYVPTKW